MRPLPGLVTCSSCGKKRGVENELCEHCGKPQARVEPDGREIFEDASAMDREMARIR
jgi:predicted amidophosphoribosyltransferase